MSNNLNFYAILNYIYYLKYILYNIYIMDDNQLIECYSCLKKLSKMDFHESVLKRAKKIFHCRNCIKIRNNNTYKKKNINILNIENKICNKCNVSKNIEEYSTHKLSKDGYQTICKNCYKISRVKTGNPIGRKPKKIIRI